MRFVLLYLHMFALCFFLHSPKNAIFRWMTRKSVPVQALTSSKTEREEQRRRGSEPQAPDKSTQSLVRSVFLHQSDKWHNEATPLNVRAVSVSLPIGLCRRQKGETREEGGHILLCFSKLAFAD